MTTQPSPQPDGAAAPPPPRRRIMRRIMVSRVEQLSPRMVRVSFTGDDLASFAWNGPAAHIKLIFPDEGETEARMPPPDGPRSTRMRTYTPAASTQPSPRPTLISSSMVKVLPQPGPHKPSRVRS